MVKGAWGMRWLALIATLCLAMPSVAQVPDDAWAKMKKHDDEVRSQNTSTDFWFVSSTLDGLHQKRFYIDRDTLVGSQEPGTAHGWVDMYEVFGERRPIRLSHSKYLWRRHVRVIPSFISV